MNDHEAVARAYIDALNTGDVGALQAMTSPAVTFQLNGRDLPAGHEALAMRVAGLKKASPDLRVEVTRVVADGSMVAMRYRGGGTHTGTFRLGPVEVPASGRAFSYEGAGFLTIEDGLVVAEDTVANLLEVLRGP